MKRIAVLLLVFLAAPSLFATTITIIPTDPVGTGFNDKTPADPVGGNPGTTLGDQRLNVFKYAADVWAGLLDSKV